MKIAIAQLNAAVTSIEERKSAIETAVREAAAQGSRITVLPELALTGYGAGSTITDHANEADDADAIWLNELSTDTGSALVSGLAMQRDAQVFNSALFVTPKGQSATYDKIHLYGDYEKSLFSRGTEPSPILEFEGLKFGLLVCFDVEFPERVRDLALRGAEAVLVPTALPKSDGGAFIAKNVIPVRAFENQVFVAYANHTGKDARFAYQGQSCITAPDGTFLAQASAVTSELIFADIMPGNFEACRAQNPYLEETRMFPGRPD